MRWDGGPAVAPLGEGGTPLREGGAGLGVLGIEGAVLKTGNSSSDDDAGEAIKSSCSGVKFNFLNTSLSHSSESESESSRPPRPSCSIAGDKPPPEAP